MRILIILILSGFFNVSLQADQVEVSVGEQKVIKRSEMSGHLTIINPKVARVLIEQNHIKLIGLKTGEAHLVNSKHDLKLVVYSPSLKPLLDELNGWLLNISGIQIIVKPKKILLQGEALRMKDWKTLQSFMHKYPSFILSQVSLAAYLRPELKNLVRSALKEKSVSSTQVTNSENGLKITTSAKKKDEKEAIRQVAAEWGVEGVQNSQNLELKPMIEIDIVIAEMKKNRARSLGLQLPGTYSASILPASDLSSFATTYDSITPKFHASLDEAMGKVLANPKLLCRSGEVAHFVAGGEIPIKVHSRMSADIIWKRYGVILDITPTADLNDGISTGLVTEISLLDTAHTIDGIPGLLTNRIDTHFDLRGSKTIALSGLIKSETGRDSSTIPFLGEIPVIGELFKSRDFKENRTELVVFVTPRVISPENPPDAAPLPKWNDEL